MRAGVTVAAVVRVWAVVVRVWAVVVRVWAVVVREAVGVGGVTVEVVAMVSRLVNRPSPPSTRSSGRRSSSGWPSCGSRSAMRRH